MFIIFLDVDGVLNDWNTVVKTPLGYTGVDDNKIEILAELVKVVDAKIVLTSTWKMEWDIKGKHGEDMVYLINHLSNYNLSIYDITRDMNLSLRGAGILRWLDEHPGEIDNYIVLDDYTFEFENYPDLCDHVVIMKDGIQTAQQFSVTPDDAVVETIKIIKEKIK